MAKSKKSTVETEPIDKVIAKIILRTIQLRKESFDHEEAVRVSKKIQDQAYFTGQPLVVHYGNFHKRPIMDCAKQACLDNDCPVSLAVLVDQLIRNDMFAYEAWAHTQLNSF